MIYHRKRICFGNLLTGDQHMKPLRRCGFSLVILCLAVRILLSQATTATLTGTVRDPSGSVVPNAAVILRNESSGDIRRTATNSDGYYSIVAIPAGTYAISVEAAGFQRNE